VDYGGEREEQEKGPCDDPEGRVPLYEGLLRGGEQKGFRIRWGIQGWGRTGRAPEKLEGRKMQKDSIPEGTSKNGGGAARELGKGEGARF